MVASPEQTDLALLAKEVTSPKCKHIYAYICGIGIDAAEECIQDVLVSFCVSYPTKPLADLRKLFATSIRNRCGTYAANQDPAESLEELVEQHGDDFVEDPSPTVSEQIVTRECVEQIYSAATPSERNIIARLFMGESHAEVAQALHKKRATISVQVMRMREKFLELR